MESVSTTTIVSWVGLVLIALVCGFFVIWAWAFMVQCSRCKLRIASVKIREMKYISTSNLEALGSDFKFTNSKVCSSCWDVLNDKGLPLDGTWWIGATIEYVKNTPAILAIGISIGSLVVSILAFLR